MADVVEHVFGVSQPVPYWQLSDHDAALSLVERRAACASAAEVLLLLLRAAVMVASEGRWTGPVMSDAALAQLADVWPLFAEALRALLGGLQPEFKSWPSGLGMADDILNVRRHLLDISVVALSWLARRCAGSWQCCWGHDCMQPSGLVKISTWTAAWAPVKGISASGHGQRCFSTCTRSDQQALACNADSRSNKGHVGRCASAWRTASRMALRASRRPRARSWPPSAKRARSRCWRATRTTCRAGPSSARATPPACWCALPKQRGRSEPDNALHAVYNLIIMQCLGFSGNRQGEVQQNS